MDGFFLKFLVASWLPFYHKSAPVSSLPQLHHCNHPTHPNCEAFFFHQKVLSFESCTVFCSLMVMVKLIGVLLRAVEYGTYSTLSLNLILSIFFHNMPYHFFSQ